MLSGVLFCVRALHLFCNQTPFHPFTVVNSSFTPMKTTHQAAFIAFTLLAASATAFAQSTSSSSSPSLSSSSSSRTCSEYVQLRCRSPLSPACVNGDWQCVPHNYRNPAEESPCGINTIRCMGGYTAQCQETTWQCVPQDQISSSSSRSSVDRCIAYCPDGYSYRMCTEDGHPISYFADPCMNHYSVSSSSSSSSSVNNCGPNPLLCTLDKKPACVSGSWTCIPRGSGSSSSVSNVSLTSLSPSSGTTKMWVTIEGAGFARRGNIVLFGDSVIPNLRSLDGKHLRFRVPVRTARKCYFGNNRTRCMAPTLQYGAGKYAVSVMVNGSTSESLVYSIR